MSRFRLTKKAGKSVSGASVDANGKFVVEVEKCTVDFVDYMSANYVLVATRSSQQSINGDMHWATVPKNHLNATALRLKHWMFEVVGKGQFKDEFVTAGGVPLSEISLSTMESKKQPNLFFAREVLNVDGVTGGFNFQVMIINFRLYHFQGNS
ncbi:hypothetical protein D1007_40333 [Hordeum vulgare]|nr:hypothetical protein D1007_40333 [Hordeum vulgare]